MTLTQPDLRVELKDFSSIICLKAMIIGIEDALGEKAAAIALIAAGRKRGKELAQSLGLTNKALEVSLEQLQTQALKALGKEGTCLCIVDKITKDGEVYKVYTRETVCSTGEAPGSTRKCTFTLGAIQGLLEAFLGQRLRGKQLESVLQGNTHDLLQYTVF